MTNLNEDILAAITNRDVRGLFGALSDAGVTVTWAGNKGEPDEAVEVDGFGILRAHRRWTIQAYTDDCIYPVDDAELTGDLARIVRDVQAIA